MAEALCALSDLEVHIDLIPSWSDVVGRRLDYHELEGMPLMTVPRTAIRRSDQLRKRAFDVVASAAALVVLSPVFLVCAVAIKLDSRGPVLFRQRRVGRDDQRFEVLKFRSMYVDAEARKKRRRRPELPRRRQRERDVQDQGGPARHARRPLAAPHLARRAAAADQRPQRRHEPGRTAAADRDRGPPGRGPLPAPAELLARA